MGYRFGVDVGGTKVAYGLFNENAKLVERVQHPTPYDVTGPQLSDQIMECVRSLMDKHGLKQEDVEGVGIGLPSLLDYDAGYICLTTLLPNLRDFGMRDYIQERLHTHVELDNDSNCAALAEYLYGAGRGGKHMIYTAVSTGVGCGLILNGSLFRGTYGSAGEAGHMIITPDQGISCGCGNQGCFVSYSSGRYLPDRIRAHAQGKHTCIDLDQELNGAVLLEAAQANDPVALEVLDEMAFYLGICVFNVFMLLNVDVFVFGGGLVNFGPMLFDKVRTTFDRFMHVDQPVYFRFAELKEDFGIIGAQALLLEDTQRD